MTEGKRGPLVDETFRRTPEEIAAKELQDARDAATEAAHDARNAEDRARRSRRVATWMTIIALLMLLIGGWALFSRYGVKKELSQIEQFENDAKANVEAANSKAADSKLAAEKAKADQSAAEANAKNWEEQAQERADAALEAQEKADKLAKALAAASAKTKTADAKPGKKKDASSEVPMPKPATVSHGSSEYGFVASGLQPNTMTATASGIPAPKLDGRDVLVPDILVRAIPDYHEGQAVLAAWDGDGWFVRGPAYATPEAIKAAIMSKEGDYWRARGMAGRRFHPVQLDSERKPIWALIEEIWPELTEPFIDRSNRKGPCLLVRS